ncbi:MAG: DUF2797 domain-containing protein [Bacteroidales bacterium]
MAKGVLAKMSTFNVGSEFNVAPEYTLILDDEIVSMNNLIGKKIKVEFDNEIYCIKCGRKTKKSFGQGFCYPCFISAPEAEECVLRPELCRAHEGVARDLNFAKENCLIDHFVYLAWSGGLKVGVTRNHQIPTRWIDQGATYAIKVCRTSNRYEAGIVEVELKKIFGDKTPWQAMLKGFNDDSINLLNEKSKALEFINGKGLSYMLEEDNLYRISFPVETYPLKVSSVNLDKEPVVEAVLAGIKGQYLIFDSNKVFNVRNHSGYRVNLLF